MSLSFQDVSEHGMVRPIDLWWSSSVLVGVQIGLSVLAALNYFLLAVHLSPSDLGAWSILLTLPAVLIAFISLGYHKAAIYYVGRGTFAIEQIIANGVLLSLMLAVILLVILQFARHLLAELFPGIVFRDLAIMWMSTPLQLFLIYLSEASLAASLLGVTVWCRTVPTVVYVGGCVVLAVLGRLSLQAIAVIFVTGFVISSVTGLIYLVARSQHRRAFIPSWRALKECLQFGIKVQVGELAQYLSNRIDLLMVGHWSGMAAAGYYSVAVRVAEVVWYVSNSAQLALFARVAQEVNSFAKQNLLYWVAKYVLLLSGLVALAISLVSVFFLPLYLPRYAPALPLLLILLPGTTVFAIFQVLIGGLLGHGQPGLVSRLRIMLLILSLVLWTILIPLLGSIGASLGTATAYVIGTLVAVIVSVRLGHISTDAAWSWGNPTDFIQEAKARLISLIRKHVRK